MQLRSVRFFLLSLVFGFSNLTLAASSTDVMHVQKDQLFGDLEEIRERRILRVLVTHSRTDFFLDGGQILGVQADFANEFVKSLNKNAKRESDKVFVQFVPVEFVDLIPALQTGRGDIAAAFLTVTPERSKLIDFVTTHKRSVSEVVVANKNAPPISKKADLSGKTIYVLKNSSYQTHLEKLNEDLLLVGLPAANVVQADDRLLTEDLIELVNAGVLNYTVSDDFKADLWADVLPDITVLHDVSIATNRSVGWAVRKNSPDLMVALQKFSTLVRKGSLLGNILFSKYFRDTQWIDNPIAAAERQKLNDFIHLFEEYGGAYGHDALALAAQAYQESGLDNSRVSHKGAVGLMQLLPSTASDPNVAIADISDVENNVHAGAKYLAFLRQRYFSDPAITKLNQQLFAWAAYNAGPANVRRIRNAATKEGLDANVWFGNVEVMAARMISREPVRYVANIYKYYTAYKIIEQRELDNSQALKEIRKQ